MPFRRRSALRILLVLVASANLGCDDPTRPGHVAGVYVLRTARGQPLPALFWQAGRAQMRVLADTLVLNADGTGHEVWHIQFTDDVRTTAGRSELPIRYEVREERLEGVYLCQPGAACLGMIEPLRGEFTRSGLRLDVGKHLSGPLRFDRAGR